MILDGKKIAAGVDLLSKEQLSSHHFPRSAKLVVVLIGENPASLRYITQKEKKCQEFGIDFELVQLSARSAFGEIADLLTSLSMSPGVDGIILQLPLPEECKEVNHSHTNIERELLDLIAPDKDVDGLSKENIAKNILGDETAIIPATAAGVMEMLTYTGVDVAGKHAVVIGRSMIVGRPVASLLLRANAAVTMLHSGVNQIAHYTKDADIIIAATGKPGLIRGDMVKDGVIAIDVGITVVDGKLKGDIAFDEVSPKAAYISPVPGGVGPLTVAFLIHNLVRCFLNHEA